ncbi:MAG: FecR domain-containing protein [Pseudomonadota bacterium]
MNSSEELDYTRRKRAIHWFLTIEENDASDKDLEAFADWYLADSSNKDAYENVRAQWEQMDAFTRKDFSSDLNKPKLVHQNQSGILKSHIEIAPTINLEENDYVKQKRKRPQVKKWFFAIAASIILVVGLSVFWPSSSIFNPHNKLVFQSNVAEIRSISLDDDSLMVLGANSRALVEFNNKERVVVVTKGEAFFKVKTDVNRPFIVKAKKVDVKVTGTEFDVQIKPNKILVAVAEGEVEVIRSEDDQLFQVQQNISTLSPGKQLAVNLENYSFKSFDVSPNKVGDWRDYRRSYTEETLETIISDLSRYYDGKIYVADPVAKAMIVSASYDVRDVEHVLDSLTESLPLIITKSQSGYIHIQSK